jgi:hypothetical protein
MIRRWLQADEFAPLREAAMDDLAVVRSRPKRNNDAINPKTDRNPLGVPRAIETSHPCERRAWVVRARFIIAFSIGQGPERSFDSRKRL